MSTAKETKDLRQFTLHIDYATIMRSYLELLRVREANSNFQLFRFSMIISMAVKSAKKLINKKVGEKKTLKTGVFSYVNRESSFNF